MPVTHYIRSVLILLKCSSCGDARVSTSNRSGYVTDQNIRYLDRLDYAKDWVNWKEIKRMATKLSIGGMMSL